MDGSARVPWQRRSNLPSLPSEVGGAASATSPRSESPKILFCSKGDAERITRGEKTYGKLYSDLTLRRNDLTTRGVTRFGGSHSHRPEPVTLTGSSWSQFSFCAWQGLHQRLGGRAQPPPPGESRPGFCSVPRATRRGSHEEKRRMESCIWISLSEYIDPDQSQRFDHSGRNEIWREPFPPARTCDRAAIVKGK